MADLITLAEAKSYLRSSVATPEYDASTQMLIKEASAMVERYCSRVFTAQDYREIYDGHGGDTLLVHQYPVLGPITSEQDIQVFLDPESLFPASTEVDASLIRIVGEAEIGLLRGLRFYRGFQNVSVTYRAGYEEVPADLKGAVGRLVVYLDQVDQNRNIGRSSKSKRDETVSFVTDIPDIIKRSLSTYKRYDFAGTQRPIRLN